MARYLVDLELRPSCKRDDDEKIWCVNWKMYG